jgi:hypothetical protein
LSRSAEEGRDERSTQQKPAAEQVRVPSMGIPRANMTVVVLVTAIVILALSLCVYALCVIGHAPKAPPRPVGEAVDLIGEVVSVSKQAYAVKIVLNVQEANSTFHVGDSVEVTFSGIGQVSAWSAYRLEPGNVIRVKIRFVENSYWEALDSDWEYATR